MLHRSIYASMKHNTKIVNKAIIFSSTMPQLNRDILREVFYELVKTNGFKHVDKFMMAGKEPFQLVLDICERATTPVFFSNRIITQLPTVRYKETEIDSESDSDYDEHGKSVTGTSVFTYDLLLIKPITIALASRITSLDIRSYSPAYIPMLKSIDREMKELNIHDTNKQLKAIFEACGNIPNVLDGVTLRICPYFDFSAGMQSYNLPCHKLTIKRAYFNTMYQSNLYNSFLRNLRDLTICGRFRKTCTILKELKEFVAFLSSTFPNLQALNIYFKLSPLHKDYFWNWNECSKMANFFKSLPSGIKGSICFKIINQELEQINKIRYPDVQESNNEYYKISPITSTLSFKMAYWYEETSDDDESNYNSDYD